MSELRILKYTIENMPRRSLKPSFRKDMLALLDEAIGTRVKLVGPVPPRKDRR